VLRQRLTRAQRLLQTTTLPIVEIALQYGFANQSYVTTVFKRRVGLTPQRYRRHVQ
jgi:AraC-like DNA-binding protein